MNKRETITAIGDKTRLRNHDIQIMLEALIDVWMAELASGGRIEIQNFLVLELRTSKLKGERGLLLNPDGQPIKVPAIRRRIKVSPSKFLRARLKGK
jgi:nucleoid DNA-binding protein